MSPSATLPRGRCTLPGLVAVYRRPLREVANRDGSPKLSIEWPSMTLTRHLQKVRSAHPSQQYILPLECSYADFPSGRPQFAHADVDTSPSIGHPRPSLAEVQVA
jgi:hypothetical protein